MVLTIQDILFQLETIGIFDFVLPFLLVFAIVFGVLQYMPLFGNDNKGVRVVIAFVVGLLAIRFPFFTSFYQELFPRLGIGITILVSILILIGMFFTEGNKGGMMVTMVSIGFVIALIIFYQTFTSLGWLGGIGGFGAESVGWIIGAAIFIGLIIVIAVDKAPDTWTKDERHNAVRVFDIPRLGK